MPIEINQRCWLILSDTGYIYLLIFYELWNKSQFVYCDNRFFWKMIFAFGNFSILPWLIAIWIESCPPCGWQSKGNKKLSPCSCLGNTLSVHESINRSAKNNGSIYGYMASEMEWHVNINRHRHMPLDRFIRLMEHSNTLIWQPWHTAEYEVKKKTCLDHHFWICE